jgi:hypothetical protein
MRALCCGELADFDFDAGSGSRIGDFKEPTRGWLGRDAAGGLQRR